MSRKRFATEQIIHKLRQAEAEIAKGKLSQERTGRSALSSGRTTGGEENTAASSPTKPDNSNSSKV